MNYNIYVYYLIQISWDTKVLILISKTYFATMEKHHKLCHLNIDQMYLLHPILIKRNVWQSLERIDLLELKVRLPLLFFPP